MAAVADTVASRRKKRRTSCGVVARVVPPQPLRERVVQQAPVQAGAVVRQTARRHAHDRGHDRRLDPGPAVGVGMRRHLGQRTAVLTGTTAVVCY